MVRDYLLTQKLPPQYPQTILASELIVSVHRSFPAFPQSLQGLPLLPEFVFLAGWGDADFLGWAVFEPRDL